VNQHNNQEDSRLTSEDIELSVVIPCYNEEEVLPVSIPPLLTLCRELNLRHEVIMVNNGSWDSTPKVIDSFISQGYPVRRVDVTVNQGWGWGVTNGLKEASGRYVTYMCCDGQIVPDDLVRTFRLIQGTQRGIMAKVKRHSRADGWLRIFISRCFNLLFRVLFGAITEDVNGTPKIFHRDDWHVLNPTMKGTFFDAEVMIKTKMLGLSIVEVPVIFHRRQGGTSTVKVIPESLGLLKDLIQFRWGKDLKDWARDRLAEEPPKSSSPR